MNQFHKLVRWAWSILVVCALAFAMGGCDGKTGPQGPQGPTGNDGADGADGADATADPAAIAIASANFESCGVCHDGFGAFHQLLYDEAFDPSNLELTITDVSSADVGGGRHDLTIEFSIAYFGAPYSVNPTMIETLSFKPIEYSDDAGGFVQPGFSPFPGISAAGAVSLGGGNYRLVANVEYNINAWDSGAIGGFVGEGQFEFPDNPYAPPKRVQVYADQASDLFEVGNAPLAYASPANASGCAKCHGTPYKKHGNIDAAVAGLSDFVNCKNCHFDDREGGHFEWQQMVDDPLAWATGVAPDPALYAYNASVGNVVHMSHAMEFPYPMSMANCNTCHEGNIAAILDDSNFTPETCKSCHVVQGVDAWPDDLVTGDPEMYAQPHRPPPLEFLWTRAGVDNFHDGSMTNCTTGCHGVVVDGFSGYHTGYDAKIYDANGAKYADMYTVSVDNVTVVGDLMTIEFSGDALVVPELLVSFYGWDTKHFVVGSHERDADRVDCAGRRPGCKMEYVPESSGGSANPLFTEEAGSAPGTWIVTLDMSALQLYKTDSIPQLILDGVITKAEVSITPELTLDGNPVVLEAVSETWDLAAGAFAPDYFQGANAVVDIEKCNSCHDVLASTFHTYSGRGGDSMQVCKACHTTTFPGSHLEMQSRSIDSYVHAIHAFQPFDEGDVFNNDDPVETARNDLHKHHTFPNFTIMSCEGCHNPGTYDVPDQSQSMPGVQSASWTLDDPSDRAIGTVPEAVQGATSRSCGGCHRAQFIKEDQAGDLATYNAHTAAFGTYVDNVPVDGDADGLEEEPVLWGIIDKIMSIFE